MPSYNTEQALDKINETLKEIQMEMRLARKFREEERRRMDNLKTMYDSEIHKRGDVINAKINEKYEELLKEKEDRKKLDDKMKGFIDKAFGQGEIK